MDILIFKTNISGKEEAEKVKPALERRPGIYKWTIDHGDVDKVLRIESVNVTTYEVENLISSAGYYCEEMED